MSSFFEKRKSANKMLELIGEPSGDLSELIEVLKHGLSSIRYSKKAYLSLVRYEGSDLGIGLFLEADDESMIKAIAYYCYENVGEIDIFNIKDMEAKMIEDLKSRVEPFV